MAAPTADGALVVCGICSRSGYLPKWGCLRYDASSSTRLMSVAEPPLRLIQGTVVVSLRVCPRRAGFSRPPAAYGTDSQSLLSSGGLIIPVRERICTFRDKPSLRQRGPAVEEPWSETPPLSPRTLELHGFLAAGYPVATLCACPRVMDDAPLCPTATGTDPPTPPRHATTPTLPPVTKEWAAGQGSRDGFVACEQMRHGDGQGTTGFLRPLELSRQAGGFWSERPRPRRTIG